MNITLSFARNLFALVLTSHSEKVKLREREKKTKPMANNCLPYYEGSNVSTANVDTS